MARLTQTKPFFDPSRSRNSRAFTSGRTAVSNSTASSLSTMRFGSAKTDMIFTSVASTMPLRSTMSGRARDTASEAARRSVCGSGLKAR